MADSGSFNADLGINMQFNIDGAGLVEMTKTIKEISKGKDLQRYWKDVEAATDSAAKAIERYNKNTQSKGLAENFLKQINALKAITNKENMADIFPNMDINFDELIESAKKLAPKINAEFSSSNFRQAFKTFDLLKDKGIELGEVFSKLADYSSKVDENFKLRRENNEFRDLFGEQDIDKIKKDLSEIQKLRNEAEETFNNFLSINKIEKIDYWGDEQFSEYFNGIRNGSLTATEAIAKFKTEYTYLLEKSFKSNNDTFGLDQLQAFSTKLDSIFRQVEETSNKINDILSNGVIAKSVQNLSEDTTLSDSQRSIFGNIFQDEESLKSITALFQKLIDETNQAKNTEVFSTEQFTKIESLFTSIELSLSSIKGVLVDVGDGEELSPLLKQLDNIREATSNIKLSLNLDLGNEVFEQLNTIVSKLDEISVSEKGFAETFKNGLNVNASVEEIEKLTNRVKELESELAKIKTPFTETKHETEGMEKVEKATDEAIQAKKDFATANEGVQSSIDGSKSPLQLEAELMDQIAKSARDAADAKKEFVEANKHVKGSANKSNNDLNDGHSENAEPSGVKKYKKKGYKAHDTGNHDNEKKVSNKAELGQALRELQSEIIASIDESTSFVKEITDFYDSQNNLVKTQTKVGDKNGGVRTYTHSYSMDKEGNTTAWTSHIDSKKYQDQNKIIQEQIKNLQKLSSEKQKAEESERKSTVSQASKDQLEAWKQIQRIRKEIAGTSNTNIIQQLKQEKKSYQEQFNVATKILKNNSDLYNSEQRLNELKKISLKTTQQIESTQKKQLNGYDNKLSGYQDKVSGYQATIDKFGKDGWTSPTYSQKVNEAQQALEAYENEINRLKANPDLVNKESLADVEKLGKDFENATLSIKNMTAAQKGYTQLGAEKALDKIAQMVKENSKMSRQAKADIQAWYNQIKSGNPSASLDVILGKVESIVRAEKEAGRGGKSMWDAIKEKAWYGAASAIGTYFGVNDIFRYGQQAVSTIVELDTALVDLKKTTSMSSSELENFYYDSNNVAKQMGVTTKEIIDQASAWSRLGYSSQEAATTMAKLSSKFASISPGMSTDEAQEGLVSIMKAFDIDPNDVETEIMDKVNILGNKFAEENQDVVEGLKRSSAAMAAMGQTFTDTAALFTGGMEILQDAESMGTALRTLSMRVRGYDEETEELSDDLVNVTGEVADLTKTAKDAQGVSLFTDATQEHYKSMVEYLGEISDRWDQISEKNQTELLQKLFGKNRANAGAAIIQNFDQVRSAIEAMDESAGSSDKEMSTIEQSLEYKINSLKETWVGTVQQMIDRGDIGKVVDALTKISEAIGFVVDKLGLLKTTVLGVTAALSFKNVGRDKMYSLSF